MHGCLNGLGTGLQIRVIAVQIRCCAPNIASQAHMDERPTHNRRVAWFESSGRHQI